MKKQIKDRTIVISAASLILSGVAYSEVMQETQVGQVPGAGNQTPTIDSDNMTVPEPYLPETRERPMMWDYDLYGEINQSTDNRNFIALNSNGEPLSIRSAQQILNDIGYSVEVDGIAGRETKSALRDFQAANGIAQTEKLDAPTSAALRDAASMDADRFPASFEDENLPYDSAFPPFPGGPATAPEENAAPRTGPNNSVPR